MDRNTSAKMLLTALFCGCSSQAFSAAFQLNEHSASGLGRSFAGEAAIADDASVISRNPAGMALFDTPSMSIAASYINPDIDVSGATDADAATDVAPQALVPATYYIHPINKHLTAGVGLFSNYGLATKYPNTYHLGPIAGQTRLLSLNLNPSLAYRINPQFSVGLGLNAVFAKAELVRNIGNLSGPTTRPTGDRLHYLKGDSWGHGWNIGALYEVNPEHRFGLTYRSQVKLDLKGDYTNDLTTNFGTVIAQGSALIPGSLKLELPAIMEFSGYHRVQPKWAAHYSVMRVGWSSFNELRAVDNSGSTLFRKEENFRNSWRYSLGGTYYMNDDWTLRAGLTYDDSPIPDEFKSISIPDANRFWYSFGSTYTVTEHQKVDIGLTYIKASKDVSLNEPIGATNNALTTKSAAYLFALQWNMKF